MSKLLLDEFQDVFEIFCQKTFGDMLQIKEVKDGLGGGEIIAYIPSFLAVHELRHKVQHLIPDLILIKASDFAYEGEELEDPKEEDAHILGRICARIWGSKNIGKAEKIKAITKAIKLNRFELLKLLPFLIRIYYPMS